MPNLSMNHLLVQINQDEKRDKRKIRTQQYFQLNTSAKIPTIKLRWAQQKQKTQHQTQTIQIIDRPLSWNFHIV